MKLKNYIILLIILVVIVCIGITIYMLTEREKLTCIKENDCTLENCYSEYTFVGYNNKVAEIKYYKIIYDNERHEIINKYSNQLT